MDSRRPRAYERVPLRSQPRPRGHCRGPRTHGRAPARNQQQRPARGAAHDAASARRTTAAGPAARPGTLPARPERGAGTQQRPAPPAPSGGRPGRAFRRAGTTPGRRPAGGSRAMPGLRCSTLAPAPASCTRKIFRAPEPFGYKPKRDRALSLARDRRSAHARCSDRLLQISAG